MSTKQGGLGLVDPRTSAIPTLLLQLRKCIQYSTDGVWVSKTQPNVPLPPNISSLFRHWRSSHARPFTLFRKYLDEMTNTCIRQQSHIDDRTSFFIYNSSLNTCLDR